MTTHAAMAARIARFARAAIYGTIACAFAVPAAAQDVRLAESPRSDGQRALQAFLDRGDYELWTRDTVLARSDTVAGNVLLLEGNARIAGTVTGDLYAVDGDVFLRTGGEVGGDIVVLGGGFYDSDLAVVVGAITYRPNEPLRVRPMQGGFEIISEVEKLAAFEAVGTRGIDMPSYDRVDALSTRLGGLVRLVDAPGRPELEASIRHKVGRGAFDGGLRNSWYPSDRVRLGLFFGETTRSNDTWIRPGWYNSLAHFVAGDDARDYYRVEEGGIELELVSPEPPIWEDAPSWRLTLAAGVEDAGSLRARDVTTLFGADAIDPVPPEVDPVPPYPNPPIDRGTLFSARAGFEWSKRGRGGRTAFGLGVEVGREDEIHGKSEEEFDFLLVEGRVSGRRITSWGHAVELFAIGRADLTGRLPRQRFSTIGGVGTLPTMPLRGLRGARLLYADATYAVPLLGMAALGGLDVFVRGSVGGVSDDEIDFELHESIAAGFAVRLWDFQMELGAAAGSTASADASDVVVFFDVRVRRAATPSQMPRTGRGF